MVLLLILFLSITLGFLYIRYFPVRGVPCVSSLNQGADSIKMVDVRDYIQSYKDSIPGSANIPVMYLKRNYRELSHMQVFVVASNRLEKNISIRFLRKKDINVVGYRLTSCKCEQKIKYKPA
jgi:hypothetical protein